MCAYNPQWIHESEQPLKFGTQWFRFLSGQITLMRQHTSVASKIAGIVSAWESQNQSSVTTDAVHAWESSDGTPALLWCLGSAQSKKLNPFLVLRENMQPCWFLSTCQASEVPNAHHGLSASYPRRKQQLEQPEWPRRSPTLTSILSHVMFIKWI